MKNTLQLIGSWLASKFNKIEATFSTKDELKKHNTSSDSHKDIRGKIDGIIDGATIVAKSEYAQKLGTEQDSFTKQQIEQILNALLSDADLDPETFILTFTYRNGTQKTFDLPIEATVKDGRYDDETKELVLVLVSDQEIRIPASGLIKVYIGRESTTTTVSINERTGEITVDVKEGAITKEHLTPELQTEVSKLENLPENANGTFATKEELEKLGVSVNVFKLDFDKEYAPTDTPMDEYVANEIIESLGSISFEDLASRPSYFFVKYGSMDILAPLKLDFTYKSSRAVKYGAALNTNVVIFGSTTSGEDNSLYVENAEIVVTYNKVAGSFNVLFDTAPASSTKVFNMSLQAMKALNFDETYNLRLGATAAINWARLEKCDTWDDLSKYIQDGNVSILPLINLKTPTSKYLYPAAVDFLMPSGLSRDVYSISIRYIGEVDGKEKLITETLDFTNYKGETGLSKCLGTNYCNYIKTAQDIVYPPCIIHIEDGMMEPGADQTHTVNAEDVEAYYQKVMAGMDKNNVRIAVATSLIVPVNVIVESNMVLLVWSHSTIWTNNMVNIDSSEVSCMKDDGGVWTCTYKNVNTTLDPDDYMKLSNIHVVSEHPTDLSTYPDGSIFIKTE